MDAAAVQERLRQARTALGEPPQAFARRIGVREEYVQAIEAGRFGELPPGIYARAALRSVAAGCGLDPADVLAVCEPLLPAVEDPIAAIARVRQLSDAARRPARAAFRGAAVVVADALIAGVLLTTVCGGTALAAGVSVATLNASALSFAVLGLALAAGYLAFALTLRRVTVTVRPKPRAARIVRRPALVPSRPRPPDRAEVLTWSMRRRGPVPPPPLRPRRG